MKAKYIFAASLLVAGAAFADTTEVETSYVVGVFPWAILCPNSSSAVKYTISSVILLFLTT